MKSYKVVLCCAVLSTTFCLAQDLQSHVQAMKSSYAGSGNIVVLDDRTLVIEPSMPSPLCALPKIDGDKTSWSYYTFPLASITVPLASVDETLIGEDQVYTDPEAARAFRPGDHGETTMVVIVGEPGKQFHALSYDRDKLASLGPGPHSSSEYGQAPDDVEAFGLTFSDYAAARTFVAALKNAVVLAKAQQTARP
jgi:hypothetical protein